MANFSGGREYYKYIQPIGAGATATNCKNRGKMTGVLLPTAQLVYHFTFEGGQVIGFTCDQPHTVFPFTPQGISGPANTTDAFMLF
jgi:hypothetical protein